MYDQLNLSNGTCSFFTEVILYPHRFILRIPPSSIQIVKSYTEKVPNSVEFIFDFITSHDIKSIAPTYLFYFLIFNILRQRRNSRGNNSIGVETKNNRLPVFDFSRQTINKILHATSLGIDSRFHLSRYFSPTLNLCQRRRQVTSLLTQMTHVPNDLYK